jgi:hypothetical protein
MCELTAQIDTIVAASCVNLFSHYGVAIERVTTWPDGLSRLAFCATIGFTGPAMRGSLLVGSSCEPLVHAGDDPRDIRDWLAELANQMVGRIKNRLVGMGTAIYYSTPTILRGEHLAPLVDQPPAHLFRANGGVVAVWFDVDVGPDLVLADDPTIAVTPEGEALLF